MTNAIDPQPASPSPDLEPPLTKCPAWCEYDALDHGWMHETADVPARNHLIDFGTVTVSSMTAPSPARQPEANVVLVQEEVAGGELGPFLVALCALYYPHLTPAEARQVAAALTAAADRADELTQ